MDYAIVWFVFWAVLWTGYFALDGFDLGVGYSGWLAAETPEERGRVFASIGPFWDGNEVWLITAGGATFAAFPPVYASLFSWLYPALFLLLFCLIFRGVALEFRGKVADPAWKTAWERTAAVSSFLAALLLGVAFGNIFRGLEIGPSGYVGTFLGLLNPYGILTGLLFCAMFLYHGQLWIASRVEGAPAERALELAKKSWLALMILYCVYAGVSYTREGLYSHAAFRLAVSALTLLLVSWSRGLLQKGRPACAFHASFAFIAALAAGGFARIYPALLPSRIDPSYSLTIFNSASSPYTLKLMTIVVVVFLPVVIGYQVWVHRVFRSPLTPAELKKSGMY